MILLRIIMNVRPEKQKEVLQTLLSMAGPMKKRKGCLSYSLSFDKKDPNQLFLLEEWENREKLDRHLNSDIFSVLLGIKSLLCKPHGIHIDMVQQVEGMNAVLAARGDGHDGA